MHKKLDRYIALFPSDTPINIARREISDLCFATGDLPSGIYRLNVPTGGGKTLSGLRFALEHLKAHNKKRIILVSPLLSILDQNAKEVRKALNNDDIILEHHSNIIREKAHGDESDEDDRCNYLTESWNSPVIITTLVQLLNTMFSGKMSAVRRFHALANSVIVIDEVQTVPANMLSIFNSAVNFLQAVCGATVVMCSATQPILEKVPHPLCGEIKDIVPKDIIATHSAVFKRTEIVDKGYLTEQEIADFVLALFETNKSTLVICNKKGRSAEFI
ncbi:MAG: DEAD/DEAH box helicase [Clostridiales bacterium]|nr:DEAD/DEAH box helicase [Clostridiales bacterium]